MYPPAISKIQAEHCGFTSPAAEGARCPSGVHSWGGHRLRGARPISLQSLRGLRRRREEGAGDTRRFPWPRSAHGAFPPQEDQGNRGLRPRSGGGTAASSSALFRHRGSEAPPALPPRSCPPHPGPSPQRSPEGQPDRKSVV